MGLLDQCNGKWPMILAELGLPEDSLRKRQGPCPLCGGKDRFRFDDKEGRGTWYCNQCGAGTGYTLLVKFKNWTPGEALRQREKMEGTIKQRTVRSIEPARIEKLCRELWANAKYPALALDYLRGRGLTINILPDSLRGSESIPFPDSKDRFPGLLARIESDNGELITLHRTFLSDVVTRKASLPPLEGKTIKGASIHFPGNSSHTMIVGEGIETTLAARELTYRAIGKSIPARAAVSAMGVENLILPLGPKRLLIFGDNDASYTGQAAAYALAKRAVHDGMEAHVLIPPVAGWDWLDVLVRWRKVEEQGVGVEELMTEIASKDPEVSELMRAFNARVRCAVMNDGRVAGKALVKEV